VIEKLKPLLKKKAPSSFKEYPLSFWRGKRWAIDANIWKYQYWKVAVKQVARNTDFTQNEPDLQAAAKIYIEGVVSYLTELLANSITPIIVYDGKAPTEKYEIALKKRAKQKKKDETSYQELREQIRNSSNLFAITSAMKDEIATKYTAATNPTPEVQQIFREVMFGMGIPQLQAIGEAEWLCSFLCRQGFVDAVYSRDTDCLPHGCPYLIHDRGYMKNPRTGRTERSGMVLELAPILREMSMSHDSFVDFCIMCGCDYSINIPGIAVGFAFQLISKHGSIDSLPPNRGKTPLNRECLNHIRCREIFSLTRVSGKSREEIYASLCEQPDYTLRINIDAPEGVGQEYLVRWGFEKLVSKSRILYRGFEHPCDEFVPVPWNLELSDEETETEFESVRSPKEIILTNTSAAVSMDPAAIANVSALKEKARQMMIKSGMEVPKTLQTETKSRDLISPTSGQITISLPNLNRTASEKPTFVSIPGLSQYTLPNVTPTTSPSTTFTPNFNPNPNPANTIFVPNLTPSTVNPQIWIPPSSSSTPTTLPTPSVKPTFYQGCSIPFGSFHRQ
jgi:5'-3' exonuclease